MSKSPKRTTMVAGSISPEGRWREKGRGKGGGTISRHTEGRDSRRRFTFSRKPCKATDPSTPMRTWDYLKNYKASGRKDFHELEIGKDSLGHCARTHNHKGTGASEIQARMLYCLIWQRCRGGGRGAFPLVTIHPDAHSRALSDPDVILPLKS